MPEEKSYEYLKKQLKECEKQRDEYLEGWKRAKAEFVNQKKTEVERMEEVLKGAAEDLILRILPVMDNFDRAKNSLSKEDEDKVKGFLQIRKQLEDLLKDMGVEEVKSIGEDFDPKFHEAIDMIDSEEGNSGKICEEVEKGYKINGRVVRPAKVRVAK